MGHTPVGDAAPQNAVLMLQDGLREWLPALAREWVAGATSTLRRASSQPALAHERMLVMMASEALSTQGPGLEQRLVQAWHAALTGPAPGALDAPLPTPSQPASLALVDEQQAETEIELARLVQLVELKAEWALRELGSLMATLHQTPADGARRHALSPPVFAAALVAVVAELGLKTDERRYLLRTAGPVLADGMASFYQRVCERLTSLGVQPQPWRAPRASQPPAAPTPDAAAPRASPAQAMKALMDRLPQSQAVDAGMQALFAELHADTEVPEAVKGLIAELQPCLRRVARQDPTLLSSTRHPAWCLIDGIAQHARGYAKTDPDALEAMRALLQPALRGLAQLSEPGPKHFDAVSQSLRRLVAQRSAHQSQQQADALAHLQQADERLTLEPVLRRQLEARLADAPVDDAVRAFLLGPWVQVMARVLAAPAEDEAKAESLVRTAEELLEVLKPTSDPAQRQVRSAALPDLMRRLRLGMDSIGLSVARQEAVLESVLRLHAERMQLPPVPSMLTLLDPQTPPITQRSGLPAAFPLDEPSTLGTTAMAGLGLTVFAHILNEPDPGADQPQEPEEPEEPAPFGHDTDVGSLPTVPMPYGLLDADHASAQRDGPGTDSPRAWTNSLAVGDWCKLSLTGEWVSAQLLWISRHREFFVFKRSQVLQLQSASRSALERLRAEGLATQLEERPVVQRAVESLLVPLR